MFHVSACWRIEEHWRPKAAASGTRRGIKHKAVGNLTVLTVCIPRGVFNDIHELE